MGSLEVEENFKEKWVHVTCFIDQHSGYLEAYTQTYRHIQVTVKNRKKMKSQASFLKGTFIQNPIKVSFLE